MLNIKVQLEWFDANFKQFKHFCTYLWKKVKSRGVCVTLRFALCCFYYFSMRIVQRCILWVQRPASQSPPSWHPPHQPPTCPNSFSVTRTAVVSHPNLHPLMFGSLFCQGETPDPSRRKAGRPPNSLSEAVRVRREKSQEPARYPGNGLVRDGPEQKHGARGNLEVRSENTAYLNTRTSTGTPKQSHHGGFKDPPPPIELHHSVSSGGCFQSSFLINLQAFLQYLCLNAPKKKPQSQLLI